ncbi:MAG: hypothetical protein AAB011_04315 [Candidatus Eisenbacteria bacterium]
MNSETITYRRDELYDQVWKEPVRTVARGYGISDVWLAKVCRKLSVPLPGRGYWARKRAGWDPKCVPLPPIAEGVRADLTVPRRRQQVFLSRLLKSEAGEDTPRPAPPEITVADTLGRPHKLVTQAGKLLRGSGSSDGYVACYDLSCLKIRVPKASLGRALRIMDALLRALEGMGHTVEVTRPRTREERQQVPRPDVPDNATRVLVSGEWIEFGIFEVSKSVKEVPEPPKYLKGNALQSWLLSSRPMTQYVPTGALQLRITNCEYLGIRRIWGDAKNQRIEKCLGAFVVYLEVAAAAAKQDRLEREAQHREWEEKRRLEEEARTRAREEAERARRFEDHLRDWRLARDTRAFVAEARAVIVSADDAATNSNWTELLGWAEAYADRLDPLGRLRKGC